MSGFDRSCRERNWSSVGIFIAGAWTCGRESHSVSHVAMADKEGRYIFHDSFLGTDDAAILESVLGKIDLDSWCLVLYFLDGPFYV